MDLDFFGERDRSDDEDKGFPGDFGDDDDYEYTMDTGPKFEAERGAYERTGPGGRLNLTLIQGGNLGELQKKATKELATPEERFQLYVDAISRKLNGDGVYDIGQADIDAMLDMIPNVQNVRYKNPTAYILGYLASRGGSNMDSKTVKNVLRNIDSHQIVENGVTAPDVIRYGRYWMTLK